MAKAGPVGDVDVRAAWLADRRHDRVVPVAKSERRRGPDIVGQCLQLGHRDLLKPRPHAAGKLDQTDPEPEAGILPAYDQTSLGQWPEQAVDAGPVGFELAREVRHGQAIRVLRKRRQEREGHARASATPVRLLYASHVYSTVDGRRTVGAVWP